MRYIVLKDLNTTPDSMDVLEDNKNNHDTVIYPYAWIGTNSKRTQQGLLGRIQSGSR